MYTCIFRKNVISTSLASLTSSGSSATPLTSSTAHSSLPENASLASSCLRTARPSCVLRPNISYPPSSSWTRSFQWLGQLVDDVFHLSSCLTCMRAFRVFVSMSASIFFLSTFNLSVDASHSASWAGPLDRCDSASAPHGSLWLATGNASQRAALCGPAPNGRLVSATGNASQRAALCDPAPHGSLPSATDNASQRAALSDPHAGVLHSSMSSSMSAHFPIPWFAGFGCEPCPLAC